MAKIMLESVVKYLNDHQHTPIATIDVVIYHDDMVNDFVESMKKVTQKKDKPWWQKLGMVSDFISFFTGECLQMTTCVLIIGFMSVYIFVCACPLSTV